MVDKATLDEIARAHGYRRELGFDDARFVIIGAIVSVLLPIMGIASAIATEDSGERVRSLTGAAVGLAAAWFAFRFLRRPTRPKRDDDFERELRYRGLL